MKSKPIVTDHAVLRYLERKGLINVPKVRKKIMSKPLKNSIRQGASGYIKDGLKYVIQDGRVVTILKT